MKRFAFIASLVFIPFLTTMAQDQVEALRYSMFSPVGTARYQGMGGALGAVGGDFTSVAFNPAGLAVYRSSEFEFTTSFQQVRASSDFLDNTYTSRDFDFNFSSLGYVVAKNNGQDKGLVGLNFGFGYNTLANFSSRISMRGINNSSSFLDDMTLYANQNPSNLDPFYDQIAFDAYLIPMDPSTGEYWNDFAADNYGEMQVRQVETSGYIGEYSFTTAVNISNFLYLGATAGLQPVRFYESIYHDERDTDGHVLDLQGFTFSEYNTTEGAGFSMKFGAIVRPLPMLRLGVSYHLPTFYSLVETKETEISSYWDATSGISDVTAYSPYGRQQYSLRSPGRFTASGALILGKLGLISMDYEFVDYSAASFGSAEYLDQNDAIAIDYRAVHNFKVGGELRLQPLYLRAGLQTYMSPFSDTRNDASVLAPSCGLGFRSKKFYVDMSYQYKSRDEVYGLYLTSSGDPEISLNTYNTSNVLVTLGFRF